MQSIKSLTLAVITLSIVCSFAFGYDPYTGRFQQQDPIGTGPRVISGPHGPQFVGLHGPTPPNPNAQTVQGIPVSHIQATVAHNPQTTQAFSAIASNQYDDCMNAYQYTGSNPVNHVDPMGLAWYVNRNGGATAIASVIVSYDTIDNLAGKIGLDVGEFREWVTLSGEVKTDNGMKNLTNLSSSDKICPNQRVRVPNTVLAYWAGEFGENGKKWVHWDRDVSYLSSLGFSMNDTAGWSAKQFEEYLETETANKNLHGMFFWGHAVYTKDTNNNKIYIGLTTDHEKRKIFGYQTMYADWKMDYKLGLGLMFACGGAAAEPGRFTGDIFWGMSGTLVPIGTPAVSSIIKPGDQETNR